MLSMFPGDSNMTDRMDRMPSWHQWWVEGIGKWNVMIIFFFRIILGLSERLMKSIN